uniref:Biotin and thiamin synthesis-associated domain-containing protein n=1 Tax=Chromera velia CCMP2878 TaxID=1169474 RepID=A0A0G4HKJ3_9ALVE|eukprot:Cvel_7220.t1-p1 / transcript=Cvel_7220.t1 / gene=Cvel_7220 / organism=Chromera_velia_CCMP2878 / gene_product=2-iminoacetate synthase, putative / transcript_product=2-iminoacetate synthase, putative / location=Cvel_scaffold372:15308-19380(+) / protein_length=574 / sequence_SO=supercontig / SO=protein_coding / is_pseudo=false
MLAARGGLCLSECSHTLRAAVRSLGACLPRVASRLGAPAVEQRRGAAWSVEREKGQVYKDANKIIDHEKIFKALESTKHLAQDKGRVREILEAAKERSFLKDFETEGKTHVSEYVQGLTLEEMATLLHVPPESEDLIQEIYDVALHIKERIYGNRIVLFAPLYIANYCVNSCTYCAFRASNKDIARSALTDDQIRSQVATLERQGHRRLLVLTGEHPKYTFDQFLNALQVISDVRTEPCGSIRRVNVEIPSLSLSDMRRLKATDKVGTYTLFQETYHLPTFRQMHPTGPKGNYPNRVLTHDRAMRAGLDDVGVGVLFGLYDYKFECLALLQHAEHLEREYNAGPHTISVPRLRPAMGSDVASAPPFAVDDAHFKKLVAILRIAVPYTGMILSTRESPEMREHLLKVGMSQMSAGSSTEVGGYHRQDSEETREALSDLSKQADLPTSSAAAGKEEGGGKLGGQFQLEDNRTTSEIVRDLLERGYVPSWCTACYRKGRTGEHFMKIAKAGNIHNFCHPNSLLTLKEWLMDYADPETKGIGERVIKAESERDLSPHAAALLKRKLQKVEKGQHDVYI